VLNTYRAAVIGCGRTASLLEDDPLRAKPCTHMGHYRKSRRIRVVFVGPEPMVVDSGRKIVPACALVLSRELV